MTKAHVRVVMWDEWIAAEPFSSAMGNENTWFVEFADSPAEAEVERELKKTGSSDQSQTIYDYAGRPLLMILGPVEKFSQN